MAARAMVAETSMTTKPRMPTRVMPGDGAGHQDADAGHEADAGQDRAAPGGAAQVGAAEGGGELGVLLDEGAFHLLQRSQLFLGERHGNLPSHDDSLRPV